jgi:hypothetical protein
MPYIPLEFQEHELIKTAKVFWLLAPALRSNAGWPLEVWFDRTSNEFLVFNLPTFGTTYKMANLPEDGPFEFETETPWKYASDASTTTVKVIVRDLKGGS